MLKRLLSISWQICCSEAWRATGLPIISNSVAIIDFQSLQNQKQKAKKLTFHWNDVFGMAFKLNFMLNILSSFVVLENGLSLKSSMISRGNLGIKMLSYQCRDTHHNKKTVPWLSYLYHEDSYTWKDSLFIETWPCCLSMKQGWG